MVAQEAGRAANGEMLHSGCYKGDSFTMQSDCFPEPSAFDCDRRLGGGVYGAHKHEFKERERETKKGSSRMARG